MTRRTLRFVDRSARGLVSFNSLPYEDLTWNTSFSGPLC